jgi:hypothetical protein
MTTGRINQVAWDGDERPRPPPKRQPTYPPATPTRHTPPSVTPPRRRAPLERAAARRDTPSRYQAGSAISHGPRRGAHHAEASTAPPRNPAMRHTRATHANGASNASIACLPQTRRRATHLQPPREDGERPRADEPRIRHPPFRNETQPQRKSRLLTLPEHSTRGGRRSQRWETQAHTTTLAGIRGSEAPPTPTLQPIEPCRQRCATRRPGNTDERTAEQRLTVAKSCPAGNRPDSLAQPPRDALPKERTRAPHSGHGRMAGTEVRAAKPPNIGPRVHARAGGRWSAKHKGPAAAPAAAETKRSNSCGRETDRERTER